MSYNFSNDLKHVISYSREVTEGYHHPEITPDHLFLAIVKTGNLDTINVLNKLSPKFRKAITEIEKKVSQLDPSSTSDVQLNKGSERILKVSTLAAKFLNQKTLKPYHLFAAILHDHETITSEEFDKYGINGTMYCAAVAQKFNNSFWKTLKTKLRV